MIDEREFDQLYALMEASFPNNERRTYAGQKALLEDPHYRLLTRTDDKNRIIAFLASWEFSTFRFVEHIAVDSVMRGSGTGGKLMSSYMEETTKPVILEVELPETELAQRRIGFYERLGFHLNPFDYVQPPLQEGQTDLPLHIMSYPRPITEEEFTHFKEMLYTVVYKV
ncbi:GNAT family N-acetyltransferase [Sporosarcina sp. Te-1]|uniref:GNAT family N-acetyltransferase n=1 Tax=Sporosarcina sp. Te-1 TaxID=2818390 RepID=UPI001A9D10BF|nr:GNAT family N-acetyltransferase [Sporosarcina sp. Te-1]QTD40678.1 GNAT family N-acetyltransferase [Sporosarcina sp. Te-1]